jgi:uncharacterized protein
MKRVIQTIKIEAQKYFIGSSGCHDWTHVERVKQLALNIGKKEKADLNLLEIAVYLHDIGRKTEMKAKGKFCHALEGARIAEKILIKHGLTKAQIDNIVHSIKTHRYRNELVPKTIEAMSLFDADKLDSIGAVGVARDFLFAGNAGSNTLYTGNEKRIAKSKTDHSFTKEDSAILEWEIKLKHIKNKMMTKTGKAMALSRHRFMDNFFKEFWREVAGKK